MLATSREAPPAAAASAVGASAGASATRVHYEVYKSEAQLPLIERLMEADLSEPYCVFTYRYFVNQWPALCYLAFVGDECVGAIVGRLDWHRKSETYRGYIAMLCVDKAHRGRGIASQLVRLSLVKMKMMNCDEVVLETETTNSAAIQLYLKLGFFKDKRLERYYLNGGDAFRLKMWFR